MDNIKTRPADDLIKACHELMTLYRTEYDEDAMGFFAGESELMEQKIGASFCLWVGDSIASARFRYGAITTQMTTTWHDIRIVNRNEDYFAQGTGIRMLSTRFTGRLFLSLLCSLLGADDDEESERRRTIVDHLLEGLLCAHVGKDTGKEVFLVIRTCLDYLMVTLQEREPRMCINVYPPALPSPTLIGKTRYDPVVRRLHKERRRADKMHRDEKVPLLPVSCFQNQWQLYKRYLNAFKPHVPEDILETYYKVPLKICLPDMQTLVHTVRILGHTNYQVVTCGFYGAVWLMVYLETVMGLPFCLEIGDKPIKILDECVKNPRFRKRGNTTGPENAHVVVFPFWFEGVEKEIPGCQYISFMEPMPLKLNY